VKRTLSARLVVAALAALILLAPSRARAAETLCDPSFQNCRDQLLTLIQNETQGIDVGFWFMEDQRYVNAIIARWQAGVPVRLLVDPRANPTYPLNATSLSAFQNAGIPMRKRIASGILHWKVMLFAGQNMVEFGSANYSDNAFVPVTPYVNYVSETIFYEDDPAVVGSFKVKFDDSWTDTTNFAAYANAPATLVRNYPSFTLDPDMNWPPKEDYGARAVKRYNAETQKIDVDMYRVTDRRHTDAIIAAFGRGVPVRYMGETNEYRDAARLWVAWNMDRIYAAGIPLRVRASAGENHAKIVLLYSQGLTIFGSSNWTTPSATSQQEDNYFTTKSWIFSWFEQQFERKWNNSTGNAETEPFTPLPPDKPAYVSPASGAAGVATSGVVLKWDGGPWAHVYDIYFGTDPNPPLLAANQNLGPDDPSVSPKQYQTFTLPTLAAGTTYYWKIVSKTMANLTAAGPIWSFTTTGTPPPPPPPSNGATTIVLWASNTLSSDIHGAWSPLTDSTASGGSALWNPDRGASKISPALAAPANYFEQTFTALHGTAYHLWVRLRAQNNSLSNDSVHVQFDGSVDSLGSATWRIGTTSSAEVVLQDGPNDPSDNGWGWADNGWGSLGSNIYFAVDGTQRVRVQQREDGAIVDEIVLSPDTYISTPPGPRDNDATILPANSGSGSPPPPPPPSGGTVVLWATNATQSSIVGNWSRLTDSTAAGGTALWNPDAGQPKISPALASPSNYFEMPFSANAGTAYHLWVRLRAQNNSFSNDSVHVQFNDSVDANGNATMQIGTTSSAEVVLQNGPNGTADQNWGWADNGWGVLGVNVYFATTGSHTLRIQQREDGAIIDQIVLSPDTYLTTPPGPRQNDATILQTTGGT
jgi:phosphatidylserine/phosphatidylglycerophosphate/cardiolipin synthase-like enzyme